MGLVYADIQLINSDDLLRAEDKTIQKAEIRQTTLSMMVDSGATMMAINESVRTQLGLRTQYKQAAQLSDSSMIELDVVGPIDVRFLNRRATCNAMVLPGDSEPLLGAIPMEEMDVMIHPTDHTLILPPSRPYVPMVKLKKLKIVSRY